MDSQTNHPQANQTQQAQQPNITSNNAELALNALREMVENAYQFRNDLMRRAANPKRDIFAECGYPTNISPQQYQDMYDREPIARRVVELLPKESWQVQPTVYQKSSSKRTTKFEKAWDELGSSLAAYKSWHKQEKGSIIWEYLKRADIVSGIGSYGLLLFGFTDGMPLNTPLQEVLVANHCPKEIPALVGNTKLEEIFASEYAPSTLGTEAQYQNTFAGTYGNGKGGTSAKRKGKPGLAYLKVLSQAMVQVVQYESNLASPRFGKPIRYSINLMDPNRPTGGIGAPMTTIYVHWTRVLHLADNVDTDDCFGTPRQQVPFNPLLDIQKLRSGSAEMYWQAAFPGISLETHPQLGGDVIIDKQAVKDTMENIFNGLQRYYALSGMSVKTIAPAVTDPSPQIDKQVEHICIMMGCPIRVFKGSERGELASSQDDDAWNDRLRERQDNYITSRIIAPFVDRLLMAGVLPPVEDYKISWPDLTSLSSKDKAAIGQQRITTIATYLQGNCESILTPLDLYTKVLDYEEEEAQVMLEDAAQAQEEKLADRQAQAAEQGLEPAPLPGFTKPQGPPQKTPIKLREGEQLVDHDGNPLTPPVPKGQQQAPAKQQGAKPGTTKPAPQPSNNQQPYKQPDELDTFAADLAAIDRIFNQHGNGNNGIHTNSPNQQ